MNKQDIRIEYYLQDLEQHLRPLSLSQRAEIVTEIKSHIHDSLAKDPQKKLESVLQDLGAPKDVAGRYLSTKGIAPVTQASRSWLRVVGWSVAGLFAFCVVSVLFLLYMFSPLIQVDGASGSVRMLGGLINISGVEDLEQMGVDTTGLEDINIAGFGLDDLDGHEKQSGGEHLLPAGEPTKISIPFANAKIEIEPAAKDALTWDCKTAGPQSPELQIKDNEVELNLTALAAAKCKVQVPAAHDLQIHGQNGIIEVSEPSQNLDLSLSNGKVAILPKGATAYDFDVNVVNGRADKFLRSDDKQALRVKVNVINGVVKKL
jgi:hypothetical protein